MLGRRQRVQLATRALELESVECIVLLIVHLDVRSLGRFATDADPVSGIAKLELD